MAEVKLGFNQIAKPTPNWVNITFNVILYTAAAVNIICLAFADIPEHIQLAVLKYSGSAVVCVKGLSHLFGVQITDPTVPTSEVTAVKNP
jgi:hypothetical protein